MKKLVLSLAIIGFITFGALSVQNLVASSVQVEMVNFDKDPKKEEAKKADSKDAKAEAKSGDCAKSCAASCEKSCASACSSKSASAKSCCSGEKASTAKADSPDVK
jgi:hypothetical protein